MMMTIEVAVACPSGGWLARRLKIEIVAGRWCCKQRSSEHGYPKADLANFRAFFSLRQGLRENFE